MPSYLINEKNEDKSTHTVTFPVEFQELWRCFTTIKFIQICVQK